MPSKDRMESDQEAVRGGSRPPAQVAGPRVLDAILGRIALERRYGRNRTRSVTIIAAREGAAR